MNSKEYIDEKKDDVTIFPSTNEDNKELWVVKEDDAITAIDMAKDEAKQEIEDNTLYSIKKGDFVSIYNVDDDRYVVGKLERITKLAFYFETTNSDEKVYSRDKWVIKIEI